MELFDSELVASEVEFLFQNGFDFKHIIGNGRQIFKNSQFIRNSIDYQIKNNMELTAINYAIEEAFDNNIIYAIKNGFDYKNVPTKFFNSFIFVQYLIDNNELDFLISSLTIEQVLKYEIQLAEFVTLRDDNYGNFLSSSVIVKKLLSECNYDFSLLKKVRLYGVSDLSKWVAFTEELYDLGFRINDPSDCYAIVSSKDLALAYLKKSRDFTLVDKINILDGDITELIELAASLGYILNEKSNNVLLQQNDRIIKNSLLYGNIKYFDRIQRELTKEETDLAYSRGYVITPQSSYYFFQNAYAFEKEFELGNFDKIKFLKSDATDKLIQVYFDNGNIIDANTSPFIRANPLAIHLMFQRTNNIEVINLAISKIYREDFIKALEMGYIINENTPVGIINNNLLMSFYLEKRLEANPNLKDMIIRLASADKLGVNGAAASFDVLLTKTEITSLFSDVELVKLIKFIYFSNNTRAPLLDIIDKGNIELLKNIYDICASLSKTSDFDVSMLKNIVINFSSNEVLCRNFINQDFDTKDIQLLYNCVVNGMLHDGEVIDLESLRNYKKVIYDKNSKLLSGENLSSYTLKNSIFKLLCNKTYEEINILISQYFNVDRIDELLNSVNNESICEELKNYRVFMEFIEQIWKVEDIDSLKKILLSLNEQFLSGSKDLELIWSNFKNITLIAKRFYGEEIKEKITNFKDLEYLESTQIITGEESYDENAKVIIKKGKYRTGEYVYQGEQYNNKDVDLIELNGIPFVSFAHVLNAYGSGATLSDFKNPRLIGRTYVCLSAIDEEKFGTVSREANDMDHVTLLFSDFNSDQLALASNRDINSFGDDNDLELGGASSNLHPVRKVISDTYGGENGYNEYVMYREDSNGNIIYPSAVLITGIEPNESEIKAAAYLGVPLVKINKSKYISTNTYDITVNDITPSDLLNKQGEWLSLKKSIQEINTILSVQSNEIGEGQASKKM